jgi:hypothetical protein
MMASFVGATFGGRTAAFLQATANYSNMRLPASQEKSHTIS